jgi:pentatricopeptide repeat protein
MSWTHCYIPCLPSYLLPVLSAPMPYFCGIDKADLDEAMLEASSECVVVDLDEGTLKMGLATPKLPTMPTKRRSKLERELTRRAGTVFQTAREGRLETLKRMDDAFYVASTPEDITENDGQEEKERGDWDSVQEAFFRFYIALLKDYRRFLVFPKEEMPMMAGFQSKPFVLSQPKEFQPFLKQLCATQQFDAFITKRLYKPGEEDVTFFEESIDAKMNRYKMKLKKIETPFLQSAKVQRKLKTVVAPEPSKEGLEPGALYSYTVFPSTLDPSLFGVAKPLPTVIAEENRKRISRARLRTHSAGAQQEIFSMAKKGGQKHAQEQPNLTVSASSTTFTVFFMAYTAVVGRDLKELESRGEEEFEEGGGESGGRGTGAMFNRLSSADEGDGEEVKDGEGVGGVEDLGDGGETGSGGDKGSVQASDASESYESATEDEISTGVECLTTSGSAESNEIPSDAQASSDSAHSVDSASSIRRVKSIKEEMLEEARATAKAQLDLAFEVLLMMRNRDLMPESFAYQCLIDACGRCGDTGRVCELLGMMHEDGVVADSVVYSCLVKAFSVDAGKKKDEMPSFTNGYAGAVDWNKMRSGSVSGGATPHASPTRSVGSKSAAAPPQPPSTPQQKIMNFFKAQSLPVSMPFVGGVSKKEKEYHLTDKVKRQVDLGNSLLDVLYRDLYVDTFRGVCNVCNCKLSEPDVCKGWAQGESHEYRVTCPSCSGKGVTRFSVFSTADGWSDSGVSGQEGKLFCMYLSPWVLKKELMSIMSDSITTLLDPEFPKLSEQKATIYWNLIVSFRREKLPFTWLFQGSFGNSLIQPGPDDMVSFDNASHSGSSVG